MSFRAFAALVIAALFFWPAHSEAQHTHKHKMPMSEKHSEKTPPKSALHPAEGASVKIITPKEGQVFKGDSVPLEFTLKKGKRGEHVHAYVDGEMAGMFKSKKGTLTGIKPGRHTLELRVAMPDHNTELDATDRVSFTTK
jgi:Penicillin-Binding Protein C-terminus Family